jgi:hypothetical protein
MSGCSSNEDEEEEGSQPLQWSLDCVVLSTVAAEDVRRAID